MRIIKYLNRKKVTLFVILIFIVISVMFITVTSELPSTG